MSPKVADVDLDLQSRIAAWMGAAGLLLLALSPLFKWMKFGSGGVIGIRGDGKIVLAATVLALLTFGVPVLAKRQFGSLLLASQAWASVAVFWMAGLIWKVGGIFDDPDISDNPFAGILASQVSPGSGLYLGLIGALIAAGALGFIAVRSLSLRGKRHLYYISQGCAALLGILIVFFVRPTDAKRPSIDAERPSGVSFGGEIGAREEERSRQEDQEQSERAAYIANNLELYDVTVKYMDSLLDGRVPGVLFKLRNMGDRSLDKVEVTVFFKDVNGKIIAEEEFLPVLVTEYSFSGDNKPLKPGYIWQMDRGKFYSPKSVPSEWLEGAVDVSITDIRFSGSD